VTQITKYYLENDKVLDREKIKVKANTQIKNCYRLIRLVNNLIDITKIDSGDFTLNISACNIVEIVENTVKSAVKYAALKDIEIIFDTEVEEVIIACDLDAIERIVLNLLSNAIKFTPQDGNIFVNISVCNNSIQIRVKDSGIGISQDKHEMIFERFEQADKLLTRSCEGSGIGLNLVKSLIEMHDGTIEVNSEYLNGSEFIVKIPIGKTSNDQISQKNSDDTFSNVISKTHIEFSDIYF